MAEINVDVTDIYFVDQVTLTLCILALFHLMLRIISAPFDSLLIHACYVYYECELMQKLCCVHKILS